jgi:hypothetical protein
MLAGTAAATSVIFAGTATAASVIFAGTATAACGGFGLNISSKASSLRSTRLAGLPAEDDDPDGKVVIGDSF